MGTELVESVLLCPLSAAHLGAVAELERLCFAEPWSQTALSMLTAPEHLGVVLLLGEQVVAYGGMTTVLDEGSVTNIATHPAYRRRGFGRRIVSALLEEATVRGLCRVVLEVRVSNAAAIGLYESAGFVSVGTRRSFYRFPTEDAVVMEWVRPSC